MKSIIALLLFGLTSTANAGFYDGNKLLGLCKADSPLMTGYVMGMLDRRQNDSLVVNIMREKEQSTDGKDAYSRSVMFLLNNACLPPNMTAGQAQDVFCKFLTDNPASRHLSGAQLFSQSLSEAFPCRN